MSEVIQAHLTAIVPARVRAVDTAAPPEGTRAIGVPADAFFFEAEISSTTLDSHFTHMADSTLRNFAGDAAEGVSLLDSHDGFKLGVGYSAGGRYEEEAGTGRVVATFYIVPGINYGGRHSFASSDDFIRAIRSGVVRDVSVGFYSGRWVCDLCKQPYFGQGSACTHLAGYEYEIERDGRLVRELCTVTIHDARLSEVSLVYDGATPGAMILKAEQEAEAGRMSAADIRQFETQYRVKLPRPAYTLPGMQSVVTSASTTGTQNADGTWTWTPVHSANTTDLTIQIGDGRAAKAGPPARRGQGVTMNDEPESEVEVTVEAQPEAPATPAVDEEARAMLEAVRAAALQSAAPREMAPDAAVRWLNEQLATATRQMNEAQAEVARLQPLADQGRAYRDELINQAVAEGVRALGEAFPEETYRAMLTNAPLEHIRQVRDTFAAQAAVRFPGGRLTQGATRSEDNEPQRQTPVAAYGVK